MPIYSDRKQVPELDNTAPELALEIIEADFAEPRSIKVLAEAQRRFVASITEPLEAVELPPDE